jgi:hypothetical protein
MEDGLGEAWRCGAKCFTSDGAGTALVHHSPFLYYPSVASSVSLRSFAAGGFVVFEMVSCVTTVIRSVRG